MSKIEAVIWDFGGVILSSPFEAFNHYETAHGLPTDFIRSVNARNPDTNAWALLERNEISATAFDDMFRQEALALGHDVAGSAVLELISGELRPNMVRALDICKEAGLRIGCITNNAKVGEGAGMSTNTHTASAIADVMARFEHVIESSKSGLRKPDPRIYLMMCDLMGLQPDQCVYLDDLGINCKPAAQLGMKAIKVTSEEQALKDLGVILNLDFRK